MFQTVKTNEIKICSNHTEQVPLIWTFKFAGYEYWCPACGFKGEIFGSGRNVKATKKLLQSQKEWKEQTLPYLLGEVDHWPYKIKANCKIQKTKRVYEKK
jgi:hypothetical protein